MTNGPPCGRPENGADAGQQPRKAIGYGLIVAGYDGSAESAMAVRWAADLAQRNSGRLRVVWAWQMRDVWDEAVADRDSVAVPSLDGLEDIARHRLTQVLEDLLARGAAGVDIHLGRGPDSAGILLSAAVDADVLVVGSRGHGRVASALLGSVSTRCIQEANCPVLVIPHQVASPSDEHVDDRWVEAEVIARQPNL